MEKVTFFGALGRLWARIFNYKDSASGKEFWFAFLFQFMVGIASGCLLYLSLTQESGSFYYNMSAFALIGYLAFSVIPGLALLVRFIRGSGKGKLISSDLPAAESVAFDALNDELNDEPIVDPGEMGHFPEEETVEEEVKVEENIPIEDSPGEEALEDVSILVDLPDVHETVAEEEGEKTYE